MLKKMWVLFILPALLITAMAVFKENFADVAARFALFALNPVGSAGYIADSSASGHSFDLNLFPREDTDKTYPSPFENFVLQDTAPAPTLPPYDTDYPIVEMTYAPLLNDVTYRRQNCYVKNVTDYTKAEVETELLATLDFKVEKNSSEPQILIMHTHATESYQNHPELYYDPAYACRDTDTNKNMVSVGKILADKLNELGYNTLQDTTLHDYPNYNGSYERSRITVEKYLEKYPSIKVVLDVHRDAIERSDGTRIKPVVTINGKRYAQVMLISGADNGYLNMPNFRKNLRFASHFQNSMETLYPGFTRPILFDYRNYNQQLTTGSLLIEVGGHANTLEEAQNSATLIAYSLAHTFDTIQ
ncbi:MAG: stage II sporulation protein P [Oscillospiraceae bacterium]|nr:stage II sporulation protein P [Oscillospiraceae bacterium]